MAVGEFGEKVLQIYILIHDVAVRCLQKQWFFVMRSFGELAGQAITSTYRWFFPDVASGFEPAIKSNRSQWPLKNSGMPCIMYMMDEEYAPKEI